MKPERQCWRTWAHNPHLHMGPRGDEPIARCRGVQPPPVCPPQYGYRSWSPEERAEYDAMYDR